MAVNLLLSYLVTLPDIIGMARILHRMAVVYLTLNSLLLLLRDYF